MNELFREIEEDIRRERLDKLWHSFGKVMVGVSAAVILATIGIVTVQNIRQSRAMEHTATFIKGIDRINIEDYKGAVEVFSGLSETDSPYYGLAMLRKAQAEASLSDKEAAKKTYETLAQHDLVFGELAGMLAASDGTISQPKTGSAFYYTHSEWMAWQLWQQGKKEEAIAQFMALYDDVHAPASMHGRISEILSQAAPEKLAQKRAEKMPLEKMLGVTPEQKEITHE